MIFDHFQYQRPNLITPAVRAAEVTPSDTEDLPWVCRGFTVGTPGDVRVTMKSGDVVTLRGMTNGSIYPLRLTRIWLSGTTATGIVIHA